MQDLAEILEIPLTTFFRGIKTAQKVEINQTNNNLQKMSISKLDFAAWICLTSIFCWMLGRVCEAIAAGNLF